MNVPKTHPIVHLKWMNFIICELLLNKNIYEKKAEVSGQGLGFYEHAGGVNHCWGHFSEEEGKESA